MLSQALQYPFRGKRSFRSILILALIQLVPMVGQLILLGYGLDVVRTVYAGHTSLLPIRWLLVPGNGFRLVALMVIVTAVRLILFILPGLFAFVICSLALWYMFAQYSISVGIYKLDFIFTTSTASIL